MVNRFIQKIHLKKGSLSKQLNIPIEKNIPNTLLRKITASKIGSRVSNPTAYGKKSIQVTRLLKERASLAQRLKSFKHGGKEYG